MLAPPAVVYVVDDDYGVLGSLRFLLETDGFQVRTFRSGSALLDAVAENHIDCIVIDYKMPTMNGIDLTKLLRERDVQTPIVMITGYPDETISERAAAFGVHHLATKPHLEDTLVGHIWGAIREGNGPLAPFAMQESLR